MSPPGRARSTGSLHTESFERLLSDSSPRLDKRFRSAPWCSYADDLSEIVITEMLRTARSASDGKPGLATRDHGHALE